MGIGDIIGNHKPSQSKENEKATKERVDEIVKELVPEAPKAAPKPKGRPRKNSAESAAPKTPPRIDLLSAVSDNDVFTPSEAAFVADQIANKAAIRRLMVYRKRFPQFSPPDSYNPHVHSSKDNKIVIEAIKEAVRAEVEFLTAPELISSSIRNAEGMALAWAVQNSSHPAAPALMNLHSAADAVLRDPAVDLDIGLLECELTGFMPESPYLRILINVIRVLSNVWTQNTVNTVIPKNSDSEKKYSEF